MHFHEWKALYFNSNFTKIYSWVFNWQYVRNGNVPKPTMAQFTDTYGVVGGGGGGIRSIHNSVRFACKIPSKLLFHVNACDTLVSDIYDETYEE